MIDKLVSEDLKKALMVLHSLKRAFIYAERTGPDLDFPEGSRVITISDTMANHIIGKLDSVIDILLATEPDWYMGDDPTKFDPTP